MYNFLKTASLPVRYAMLINTEKYLRSRLLRLVRILHFNITSHQGFTLRCPYQEYKTPADKALGVMEPRNPPHHDKVVTRFSNFLDYLKDIYSLYIIHV